MNIKLTLSYGMLIVLLLMVCYCRYQARGVFSDMLAIILSSTDLLLLGQTNFSIFDPKTH